YSRDFCKSSFASSQFWQVAKAMHQQLQQKMRRGTYTHTHSHSHTHTHQHTHTHTPSHTLTHTHTHTHTLTHSLKHTHTRRLACRLQNTFEYNLQKNCKLHHSHYMS